MNYRIIEGRRKNSRFFVYNSYSYTLHHDLKNHISVRCHDWQTKNCKAGGKISKEDDFFEPFGFHLHQVSTDTDVLEVKTEMKRRAETSRARLREIFDDVSSSANRESATKVSFKAMQSAMLKRRRKTEAALPASAAESAFMLRDKPNLCKIMNMNEAQPPPYLQQLLSHSTENGSMVMKSEDDEYSNNHLPFLNNDCGYFTQQNSPSEPTFPNLQSPTNFTNAPGLFNTVTCAPSNHVLSNPTQPSLSPMPPRTPRLANFPPQRMGMGPALLLSHMEQLPDTTVFPGNYDFQLSLGPHTESATKSADYTYSPLLKKLYVQRGANCPFKFKTSIRPPANSYVKILPVFKGTHVLSEPVRRCSNHAEGDDEGNPRYHFIRAANNRQTQYETSESGRLFMTIPYTGPQVGAEFQVELLSFMCFNSCGHSSHSKRRIDVIFILENNGQVLGRQVIEVRVCACPGRDRTNEECSSPRNGIKSGVKRSYPAPAVKSTKRRQLSSPTSDEYTIKTSNPVFHQILLQILDTLESQIPQIPEMYIPTLRNSNSPTSSASSPSSIFKPILETESTDEEIS